MKFTIITHVNHIEKEGQYFGYAPYVREMNIWLKYIDELIVVAPLIQVNNTEIDTFYNHSNIKFLKIKNINLKNLTNEKSNFGFGDFCFDFLRSDKDIKFNNGTL